MRPRNVSSYFSVPEDGVEPSPHCWDGILSPARLPVPPLGRGPGIITGPKPSR